MHSLLHTSKSALQITRFIGDKMNVWTEKTYVSHLITLQAETDFKDFKDIQIQVLKQALKYALHTGCTSLREKLAL